MLLIWKTQRSGKSSPLLLRCRTSHVVGLLHKNRPADRSPTGATLALNTGVIVSPVAFRPVSASSGDQFPLLHPIPPRSIIPIQNAGIESATPLEFERSWEAMVTCSLMAHMP
ncbi:hypothetical protein EVAR_71329_1 [Eumeta japonica]|uniref:Uncharacterized protein n=1 Tax=Eumeta variegata TaxID=151549 RepID=A0A4C1SQZ7_EUMVA|nr:hypothetical protein EVAR_71329_1 [Eumeta japonica]